MNLTGVGDRLAQPRAAWQRFSEARWRNFGQEKVWIWLGMGIAMTGEEVYLLRRKI
jgi:hypothetical protein